MAILPKIQAAPTGAVTTTVDRNAEKLLDLYYALDVGGTRLATFQSLEGGDIEVAYAKHDIVYETGASTTLFIPTTTSFAPITLTKGIGNSAELYNWFAEASAGNIFKARKNCTIKAHTYIKGVFTEIVNWNLLDSWVQKISGFNFSAEARAKVATLSITIVAETIEREDVWPADWIGGVSTDYLPGISGISN